MTPTQRMSLRLAPAGLALSAGLGLSASNIHTLLAHNIGPREQEALIPTAVLILTIVWLAVERALATGNRFAIPMWISIGAWSGASLVSAFLYGPGTILGAAFVTALPLVAASAFEIAVRTNQAERLARQATGA